MTTDNYGTKDSNFRSASEKWELVDSLMGGTDAMRNAGETYLPKYSLEDTELYNMRLKTSTLFNAYKKAVETNVGKITARQVKVEGGSNFLSDFTVNVDSTGRNLNEFSKDILRQSINHGISYILVDFPRDTTNITLENIKDVKPHFVDINATQVMSIRSQRVRGSEELIYFKFSLSSTPAFESWDTATDETIDQIREFAKQDGQILFRVKEKKADSWHTVEEGVMAGLDFIPIVPVYGNRTNFMMGEPLLNDLAELNIRHWQSSSDQQWVLHFARSPILFLQGIDDRDENGNKVSVNVGPNSVVTTDRADADMKYVEHGGTSIASGRQDLQDIEDQMAVMGLDISVDKTGTMTATGRAINAASADSILKSVALQLEDSLTAALLIVEMFYGSVTPFTVEVNKEYIPAGGEAGMTDVWEMYRNSLITAADVLKEAKRRNLITPSFIIEDELQNQKVSNSNITIE